jgi:geranylgeranyl pyrophosphate synthase
LAAQLALTHLSPTEEAAGLSSSIGARHAEACLTATGGQHADLAAGDALEQLDPDVWLSTARAKSGAFYGWASWAGAVVGGAGVAQAQPFWEYGIELGVLLQIADDYDGVWCPDGPSDLLTGRPSLPVAYALAAADPRQRSRFLEGLHRARLGSLEHERSARADLESLGAQAFMLVAGRACVARALAALAASGVSEESVQPLSSLTSDVFPVLVQVGKETP